MGDILLSRLRRRFSSDTGFRLEFTINGNQRVSGASLQLAAYHGRETWSRWSSRTNMAMESTDWPRHFVPPLCSLFCGLSVLNV